MTNGFPALQDLARRILAYEASRAQTAETRIDVAVQVCAKLQIPIVRLAGSAGYSSLLARAVALAEGEIPFLPTLKVRPDGTLAGFEQIEIGPDTAEVEKGRQLLVTNLLGLLATFIGESLTRRLASEAWPEAESEPIR